MFRLLASIVFVGVAAVAAGQTAQPPEAREGLQPGEVQRLFDAYVIVQIHDALSLSEDQYARLLPKLRQLQQVRRLAQLQRQKLLVELSRLSRPKQDPPADEAVLNERLSALQELESRSAAELRRAYDAVDEILDARQRARFRVFEDQIERRKLQLLLRARQNRSP